MMDEEDDLRSDLAHVIDQVEKLVREAPEPTRSKSLSERSQAEKSDYLEDIEEARRTAKETQSLQVLTDVLTWALQRLEEEEAKRRSSDKRKRHAAGPASGSTKMTERQPAEEEAETDAPPTDPDGGRGDKKNKDVHPVLIMGATGWTIHAAKNGKAYWHHEKTGQSVWEEPVEVVDYRQETEVDGWGVHPAPTGKPYWHNEKTGESVWIEPKIMNERRLQHASMAHISFAKSSAFDDDDSDEDTDEDNMMAKQRRSGGETESKSDVAQKSREEEKSHGGEGKRSDDEQEDLTLSNDPSTLQRLLRDTMSELETSLVTIHELHEDRDALVEALQRLSHESEEQLDDLREKLRSSKEEHPPPSKDEKRRRGGNGGGKSDEDSDRLAAELRSERERVQELEAIVKRLEKERSQRWRGGGRGEEEEEEEEEDCEGKKDGSRDRDRNSSSSSTFSIREGDKVEAKCTGWTQYYTGEVTRINRDDDTYDLTYDLKFDDGERKRGVRSDQVRSLCEQDNDEGDRRSPKSKKKQKKKRKKKRSTQQDESPSRKTFHVVLNDEETSSLGEKSASQIQRRIRGFMARKEFDKKLEEHLMEEVVVPDFSHLSRKGGRNGRGLRRR